MLVNHIRKVKELPYLENAILYVTVERNFGMSAHLVESELTVAIAHHQLDDSVIIEHYRDENGTLGFWTDAYNKKEMAQLLSVKLDMNRIRYHQDFVSVNEAYEPHETKQLIEEQMRTYMRYFKPANGPFGNDSERYYGEGKDDLAMSLQINNYVYEMTKRGGVPKSNQKGKQRT